MRANNQMSAVLSSFNMPLQISSSQTPNPQHKAFKQFDYPPVQVSGHPQTIFHCKKIENEIGVKVAEKSIENTDLENNSVVMNVLSGKMQQIQRAVQIPLQSSSLNRGTKTKPKSAQNPKQNLVRTSNQHRQYETVQNLPKSTSPMPESAMSKMSSFDKPLQNQRNPSERNSGHQNQRRRPVSSQISKTRKEEHNGGLLRNPKQNQRTFNSNKKPRISSPQESYSRAKVQIFQTSQSNTNLDHRDQPVGNMKSEFSSEAQLPRQLFQKNLTSEKLSTIKHSKESFSGDELTMNNMMLLEQNTVSTQKTNLMNQLLMHSKPLLSSKKAAKFGTSAVKKKTQKKTGNLGSQGGTLSVGLSSKEASAEKRKYYTHDDKENIQMHSNKKKLAKQFDQESSMPMKFRGDENLHHASQKTLSYKPSVDQILLSTDIINKLKTELTKQVKKRQESKTTRKLSQVDPKQQKHIASVIPFEQKIKMRQQKQEKQQQLEQEKQRQQELEQQKRKRQLSKFKREMERKENMAVFEIFKKQVSPHQRKLSKKPIEQKEPDENQDLEDLDRIMVHKPKGKLLQTPERKETELEDKEGDEDYLDEEEADIINIHMQTQRHSPAKYGLISQLPSGKSSNPYKKGPSNQFQEFKNQFYQTKTDNNYDSENENRHQNIENFLKEQKAKRAKEKSKQEEEQTKRLTKIKSQLINLQQDYFKGLNEFKHRQVQQQQALQAVKSQERKKSKKPKKKIKKSKLLNLINQQKQKLTSPFKKEQKINYNLSIQRNSVPVMHQNLGSPNMQPRASFQSPVQRLKTFDHIPNPTDEIATSAQSRSSLGSSSKKLGSLQRESLLSQYSLPKNKSQQPQLSSQRMSQQPSSVPFQASQMPLQFKLRQEAQHHSKNQSQPTAVRNNNQQIFKTASSVNLYIPTGSFSQNTQFNQQLQQTQPIDLDLRGSMYEQNRGGFLERHGSVDRQAVIDLRSEKSAKMFEQFARIRKELEKQLKFELKTTDGVQKKKSKKKQTHFLQQQKMIAKQRQVRTEQLPLQQMPSQQLLGMHEPNQVANPIQQEYRIQAAKNQILDKLQEVAERMQSHFKQQKQQNPLKQSHQTLMLSHTNIIKEEESKDDTSYQTASKRSPSPNRLDIHPNIFQQNQLRMVPLNNYGANTGGQLGEIVEHHTLDSQEVSQIAASKTIGDDQNNTTYLLKKMYDDNNRPEIKIHDDYAILGQAHLESCVTMIQKYFRGFICRKILKEKMRIDKEFRLLRQKYEVKSIGGVSSNTPLSSLAFSQSNPKFIKRIGGDHTLLRSQMPFSSSALGQANQGFQQVQSPLDSVPTSDKRYQNPFYNQTDLLYQKDDVTEGRELISKFSVLKSPSILAEGETNRRDSNQESSKQNSVFDYQPVKLQFQDSHINQVMNDRPEDKPPQLQNYMTNSMSEAFGGGSSLRRSPQNQQHKEEAKKTEEDRSFVNDDSDRSIMPIDERSSKTPFQPERVTSQSNPLTTKEDFQHKDQTSEDNLQEQHRNYLDSPLKLNDLSGDNEDKASTEEKIKEFGNDKSPQKQNSMKRITARPISNNQERQSNNQVRARGISPIGGSSPRNLLFQQKSSFDISSLINYGDEVANRAKQREIEQAEDKLIHEEEKEPYIKIHGSRQEFGSNFSDGSPTVVEEDASPHNQNLQTKRKDDSMSHNTSIFEKNSFQQFAKDKIHKVFKAESELEKMIDELNQALKKKIKIKVQELQEQQLSVRTYNRKKLELEKWVEKEKREIKMTKKHFTQGCLRLSSLLDTLIKEQSRMKDAVSSIRKQNTSGIVAQMSNSALGQVRRSHSFDSELLPKQFKQQLSDSIADLQEANTVSGARRQTIHFFSEGIENGADDNSIKPLYTIGPDEHKKLFDYQPITPSSNQQHNQQPSDNVKDEQSEEEQLIEIKGMQNDIKSQVSSGPLGSVTGSIVGSQNILVEELKRREDVELGPQFNTGAMEDTSNNGLMMSLGSQQKDSNNTTPDETLQNNLQISDTPIYKDGQIKFPEEVQSMEDLESAQNHQVNFLVEEILQFILLRDIKERLFPPRPLSKLMKLKNDQVQQSSSPVSQFDHQPVKKPENETMQHQQIEKAIEDQIKVLDNILEELSPVDDSRAIESPEANAEVPEPSFQRQQSPADEEKAIEMSKPSIQDKIKEVQRELATAEEKKKRGIESGILQVNSYMQDIFERLKVDKSQMHSVLENVSQPLYKDPLMILAHLQNSMPEPPPQTTDSNESGNNPPPNPFESAMPFQQSVLSVDLYLDIEKEKRGGLSISQMRDSFQEDNSQSFIAEMENIHNKAIFDAVNEALDGFRPYGLRGPPLPWSKQGKTLTFKFGKEETFEYLLQKVKYRVLDWAHVNAGTLGRPTSQREKDHLELVREERLARILIQEAEENEQLWTDYEYEETQTKIDTADIILEHLCTEMAELMMNLQNRKFEEIEQPKEQSV